MAGRIRRSEAQRDAPTGVLNTVGILKCFTVATPLLSVTEIAEKVDLHKSSVSRILAALAAERFVEKEPLSGRYRLGTGIIALTAQMLSSFNIIDVARPIIRDLAETTGETANLTILNNEEVLIVDHAVGSSPIRVISPGSVPAYCNSTGRVLLAFSDDDVVNRILAKGMPSLTPRTETRKSRILEILREIRKSGFHTIIGEYLPELAGVSSPVFDRTEGCVAALSVSVPAFSLTDERAAELTGHVRKAAWRISTLMGSITARDVLSGDAGKGAEAA